MFMRGDQNAWFCKASLRIYVDLFECKGPWTLKKLTAMCGTEDYKDRLKKYHVVLLNFVHTFVFNIF